MLNIISVYLNITLKYIMHSRNDGYVINVVHLSRKHKIKHEITYMCRHYLQAILTKSDLSFDIQRKNTA